VTRVAQHAVLFMLMAALLFAAGCSMVTSESEVLGEYELRVGDGKIELKISPDKSFSETVLWPTGKVESCSGQWQWNNNIMSMDKLWIPLRLRPLAFLTRIRERTSQFLSSQSTPSPVYGCFSQRNVGGQ